MPKMRISWALLTWNRIDVVKESVIHNIETAGYPVDELVWCDNGSTDGVREWIQEEIKPHVSILNTKNVGADPGYNRCLALCRGTHIVITGCDCLMPPNWLRTFVEHFKAIPESACACMYLPGSEIDKREGPDEVINGKTIFSSLPMGRRFFRASLLESVGFMDERFGLYGWGDVIWGRRCQSVCDKQGLRCYAIPDQEIIPLTTKGPVGIFENDEKYHTWKNSVAFTEENSKRILKLQSEGWPKAVIWGLVAYLTDALNLAIECCA